MSWAWVSQQIVAQYVAMQSTIKGCRPEGRFVAMRETRVITDLLHEQLAKYLNFLCCVPQRDTSLKPLGKGYHAASLLAPALKEQAAWFQNSLGAKVELDFVSKTKTGLLLILKKTAGKV